MGFLFGISGSTEPIKPKPKPTIDKKQMWMALAPHIKKRYKTNMTTKEIAAELHYQDYLQQKKKREQWKRFSKEIG